MAECSGICVRSDPANRRRGAKTLSANFDAPPVSCQILGFRRRLCRAGVFVGHLGDTVKKIISLFQRNYGGDLLVRDEVVPGAEWVSVGEGVATRKFDGTCCLVGDGKLYRRYEVRPGKKPPPNFEPATEADPITGKQQGWVPVSSDPDDEWHRIGWNRAVQEYGGPVPDGTYELCGPHINGNPEGLDCETLIRHGTHLIPDAPRSFGELSGWFRGRDIEGTVWHHPDGRMVKIKKRDFGLKRTE